MLRADPPSGCAVWTGACFKLVTPDSFRLATDAPRRVRIDRRQARHALRFVCVGANELVPGTSAVWPPTTTEASAAKKLVRSDEMAAGVWSNPL